ncbi:MAG TPA: hypothetical protein VFW98_04760, partial [Gemmatimonadaceae bacterium]|nr:hypothetical protein [Gemmatimonadaceae bacterium]
MARVPCRTIACAAVFLVAWIPARAACQLSPIGDRERATYLDLLVDNRQLWRGYNLGSGPTLEPTIGVPLVFTASRAPQRALLFDAHAWLALSDRSDRRADDRIRFRVQYQMTLDSTRNNPWELRAGYAQYAYPWAAPGRVHASGELFVTAISPELLEEEHVPVHLYGSLSWDVRRYDGPYVTLGVVQNKELVGTQLQLDAHLSLSAYRNQPAGPRRTFSLHELGVRVLAGKLHATRTGGWQDIWLMAGVEIPAPDVTDG